MFILVFHVKQSVITQQPLESIRYRKYCCKVTNITFLLLITTANFLRYRKFFSISSKKVISSLSFCFLVLDTPEEIICDNGTQFTSKEHMVFTDKWGFTMITSSPHYLRACGFIERQVQIIKKALQQI